MKIKKPGGGDGGGGDGGNQGPAPKSAAACRIAAEEIAIAAEAHVAESRTHHAEILPYLSGVADGSITVGNGFLDMPPSQSMVQSEALIAGAVINDAARTIGQAGVLMLGEGTVLAPQAASLRREAEADVAYQRTEADTAAADVVTTGARITEVEAALALARATATSTSVAPAALDPGLDPGLETAPASSTHAEPAEVRYDEFAPTAAPQQASLLQAPQPEASVATLETDAPETDAPETGTPDLGTKWNLPSSLGGGTPTTTPTPPAPAVTLRSLKGLSVAQLEAELVVAQAAHAEAVTTKEREEAEARAVIAEAAATSASADETQADGVEASGLLTSYEGAYAAAMSVASEHHGGSTTLGDTVDLSKQNLISLSSKLSSALRPYAEKGYQGQIKVVGNSGNAAAISEGIKGEPGFEVTGSDAGGRIVLCKYTG